MTVAVNCLVCASKIDLVDAFFDQYLVGVRPRAVSLSQYQVQIVFDEVNVGLGGFFFHAGLAEILHAIHDFVNLADLPEIGQEIVLVVFEFEPNAALEALRTVGLCLPVLVYQLLVVHDLHDRIDQILFVHVFLSVCCSLLFLLGFRLVVDVLYEVESVSKRRLEVTSQS